MVKYKVMFIQNIDGKMTFTILRGDLINIDGCDYIDISNINVSKCIEYMNKIIIDRFDRSYLRLDHCEYCEPSIVYSLNGGSRFINIK